MDAPTDAPATPLRAPAERDRVWLDSTSWVDVVRGWLPAADEVYEAAERQASWRQGRLWRYERWVDEPRLTTWCRPTEWVPHEALVDAHRALRAHYRAPFDGFALAWYRDGRDSVAFHRDRDLRWCEDTLVALLVLGARRPFHLRPRANRYDHDAEHHGATHDLAPGRGDLLVLGGRCQADWEHAVPKVRQPVGGRISAQWRWTSKRGRPEVGGSFRAPRHFSR